MEGKFNQFKDAIAQRRLVLDGAVGTLLNEVNSDSLNLIQPEKVGNMHLRYIEAGADIVTTNTFNSNRISQRPFNLHNRIAELNEKGATLASGAAESFSLHNPLRRVFVAGSIGPSPVSASKDLECRDSLRKAFCEQARSLIRGGVDFLLVETVFDLTNGILALEGIHDAQSLIGIDIPVVVSFAVSPLSHRLYSGHDLCEAIDVVECFKPLSIGVNCSGTPDALGETLRMMSSLTSLPLTFYPNAGVPDSHGVYGETPESFADKIQTVIDGVNVAIVGGCCGTTPSHISSLVKAVR